MTLQLEYRLARSRRTFQQVTGVHSHNQTEIMICLAEGGKMNIGSESYVIARNTMFIIPPGVPHEAVVDIASWDRCILYIPYDTLYAISSKQTDFVSLIDSETLQVQLTDEQYKQLDSLVMQFDPEDGSFGGDLNRDVLFLRIMLLLGDIIRNYRPAVPTLSKEYTQVLPIITYIHNNYREELNLDDISQRFFVSKFYLCRLFKNVTGFTVGSYITNYRIRQACTLLRSGIDVQSCGEQVGFGSNAHFIRTFHQIMGESPGKYARRESAKAAEK